MMAKAYLFTNMFSLLSPVSNTEAWPVSLELPPLDFSVLEDPTSKGEFEDDRNSSKRKLNTVCQHFDRKHYAKNLCNNCYHRYGRYQFAYSCPHKDRKLYAKGKCQFCYLSNYQRSQVFGRRRRKKKVTAQVNDQLDC